MNHAFQLQDLEDGIVLVTFDVPDQRVNTFSRSVIGELEEIVSQLETRTDVRGLLFASGKPGQFIAGADLNELAGLSYLPTQQIEALLLTGHELFGRLSRLPFPTVALINGPCMGGGTEFVLALDYALAADNPRTQIALPEVKIGVIPAWGGTQRLPRLIGVHHAIEMITSGESVSPRRAAELGLVFDTVPEDRLVEEGRRLIGLVHENEEWQDRRERRSQAIGLSPDEAAFMFAVSEGYVRQKTKGQYPAPLIALKAMREGCNQPLDEGLKIERETALEVFGSTISANLIAVFFMQNRLDRDPGVTDKSITPRGVHRVGVLGAGLMGSGIAAAHARCRIPTVMVDVDDQQLEAGLNRARDVVAGRIKIGRATPDDMADMFAHMGTATSSRGFSDCDVVVEAIPENEQLKTKLYGELAGVLKDDTILASNTSTISITRMAASAPNAERFVGMHFFYPVDRMKLVEVVRGQKTSDETVATIVALAKRIKKTPIVVRDCPGFLVNRVLFPYMNEALVLLREGASMDAVDKAAVRFGMPMGPIALHDLVGLDTAWYAGQVVHAAYGDRSVLSPLLEDLVKAGRLGQKSGAGFRKFTGKKARPEPDPDVQPFLDQHRTECGQLAPRVAVPLAEQADHTGEITDEELTDRLFLPMLLEATRVLEEKIVREPADVDMGLILGIGFPPFRGGILRWCDSEGADNILKRLERYASLGQRFAPTETLTRLAKSNELFYPRPA